MRPFLLSVVLTAVGIAAVGFVVIGAEFMAESRASALTQLSAGNNNEYAHFVAPAAADAKHPKKITLAGAAFTCAQITRTDGGSSPGQCLRFSCTVDCAYDVGTYLPDGGVDVLDGTYNTSADGNQLPSATPEAPCLGPTEDGICFYSATAGSAYVAQRKP